MLTNTFETLLKPYMVEDDNFHEQFFVKIVFVHLEEHKTHVFLFSLKFGSFWDQ